jgi:hypothetical protein
MPPAEHVHRGSRLVEEQQTRPAGYRDGESQPLRPAAGQHRNVPPGQVVKTGQLGELARAWTILVQRRGQAEDLPHPGT